MSDVYTMAIVAALTAAGPMFIVIGLPLLGLLLVMTVLHSKKRVSNRAWKITLILSGFVLCGPAVVFLGVCLAIILGE